MQGLWAGDPKKLYWAWGPLCPWAGGGGGRGRAHAGLASTKPQGEAGPETSNEVGHRLPWRMHELLTEAQG